MNDEKELEKVYSLIEEFEFDELSESKRLFVLKFIGADEYAHMRKTISDTKKLFAKYPEAELKPSKLRSLLYYPIELYKIAVILLLFAGMVYSLGKLQSTPSASSLASVDTVYIEKVNTVYLGESDTVDLIKTKIVYQNLTEEHELPAAVANVMEAANFGRDCSKEICPEDMVLLSRRKTEGNFSTDKSLSNFMVSLN